MAACAAAIDPVTLVDQYLHSLATMHRTRKDYMMLCLRDKATSGELTHVYKLISKSLHPDKNCLERFAERQGLHLDQEAMDEAKGCLMDFYLNYQATYKRLHELDAGLFQKDPLYVYMYCILYHGS